MFQTFFYLYSSRQESLRFSFKSDLAKQYEQYIRVTERNTNTGPQGFIPKTTVAFGLRVKL